MSKASTDNYRKFFMGAMVIAVTIAFIAVMRSFLVTLLLAAIFSAILHPFYYRVLRLFRGRQAIASIVTLLIVYVVVIGPMAVFVGVLVSQAVNVSQSAVPWIQQQVSNPSELVQKLETLPGFDRLEPYREQILTKVGEFVGTIGTFMVSKLSAVTKGTVTVGLQFLIMTYAMFLFLMRGSAALRIILSYLPLSKEESTLIVDRFVAVTRASLVSSVVIGVIQGTLGGLAFWVAGIKGAVFWGTLMGVAALVPGVGAAIVWLPGVIYLVLSGHTAAGLLLCAFCAVIVSSVDNVIRPRLVGRDTKLPELIVLLSTLGGIMLMGPVGFIIGPVVAALFITVWDIYARYLRGPAKSSAS